MKYAIISIDDSRADYKQRIRREFSNFEEVSFICEDARRENFDIQKTVDAYGLSLTEHWTDFVPGEIGGWLSHFNSWVAAANGNEPLLVFEDDAIIPDDFGSTVLDFVAQCPEDYDFVSLSIPFSQLSDYMWINEYDELGHTHIVGRCEQESDSQHYIGLGPVARAYHTFGHTAVVYSPKGAQALVDLAGRRGLFTPADCFILNMSHLGLVKGYAPKPEESGKFAVFNEVEQSIIGDR